MLFKKLKILSFTLFFSIFATPSLGSNLVSVTTKPIADLTIFPKFAAPATAISLNDAVISAEINGIILQLPLQVGDLVRKGDTLAVIGCKDYHLSAQQFESQLQSTHAKIDFTEWKLNRIQSLASGHNVSQEQLKELQSNLTSLQSTRSSQKAQLSQAKLQVGRCKIQAPFNAIVVGRMADIGEMVSPGHPIIHLVDNESLEVSAQLQSSEVEKLQFARNPIFSTKDGNFPVSIRTSVGVYTERYRTQEVRCRFTGPKPLPGSVGRLVWQDNQAHLPAYLLSQTNNQYGIFIIEPTKAKNENKHQAKFIAIKNAVEGRPIPLPLQLKAELAIDGRYKLSNNESVHVIPQPLTTPTDLL